MLVVRDDDENSNGDGDDEVVSFAKWSLPVWEGEADAEEAPWVWPEGTDLAVLDGWSGVVEGAKGRVVGEEACYREFGFRAICVLLFSRLGCVWRKESDDYQVPYLSGFCFFCMHYLIPIRQQNHRIG